MADTIKIEDIEERVVLVGVSEQDGDDADDSLSELAELVKTAGATVVGTLIQRREKIHPGTYVGTGKVAEIAELVERTGATGIVCDDELSPAQQKNLETYLDTKVMDRTLVILDIFASRATTSEGKIQVELAQLKYRLSRLSGLVYVIAINQHTTDVFIPRQRIYRFYNAVIRAIYDFTRYISRLSVALF